MDAVDVVLACHLGTDIGKIVARSRVFRIHKAVLSYVAGQFGILALELLEACLAGLADGDGDHPRVALHTAAVTLVDDQLQRVVAGIFTVGSRQTHIEGFNAGWIDGRCAHTCLNHDGIDIDALQLVEYAAQFLLLCSGIVTSWPVNASDGCQPDSAYFMLLRV